MTIERILLFGTMVHPMNTLLGIAYQVCGPIFNLGHDLLYVMDSGYQESSQHIVLWHNGTYCKDLYLRPRLNLGHDLHYVHNQMFLKSVTRYHPIWH